MNKDQKKTILLVEDQALIAMSETQELKREGYNVVHVLSGEKAVEIVKDGNYDLILMDIDLGKGMDGTQAAQEILKEHNIPVVFLSSYIDKNIVDKTEKITCYGYVVKDTGITVLNASIKMAFKLFEAHININKQKLDLEISNKELLEAAKLNQQVISSTGEGIIVYSADLKYQIWNSAMEQLTGISSNQVLGKHSLEVSPFFSKPEVLARLEKALSGKDLKTIETRIFMEGKGQTKWILDTSVPLKNSDGEIIGVITFLKDIDQNEKIQDELQQSEELFRSAFETAAHGMAIVSVNGYFLQINQAFCDIVGYSKKEMLEIEFQKITHPDDLSADLKNVQSLLDGHNKTYRMEKRYYHKSGYIVWVLLSVSLVLDKNNLPLYFVSQAIDITERKMAEDIIKKEQKFSAGLISAMRDGFSLINPDGVQSDVNNSFCKMTGFSREELIGIKAPNYPYWPPEEFAHIQQAFQKSIELDFENFELIFMRKNGERFPVIVSPAPLYDDKGNIINFLATVKDITTRKRAEEKNEFERKNNAALINNIDDLIWSVDKDFKLSAANKAFITTIKDYFGLTLKPGDNLNLEDHIPEEILSMWKDFYDKAMIGESINFETYTPEAENTVHSWRESIIRPIYDNENIIGVTYYARDITEQKRQEKLYILENEVMDLYSIKKVSLKEIIEYLLNGIKEIHPSMLCSVLRLKDNKLYKWSSPHLPEDFNNAIEGLSIGYGAGACGTAAYLKKKVIVTDLLTDPLFSTYKDLAIQYGLRACWSHPVLDSDKNILATFAIYHQTVRSVNQPEELTIERAQIILKNIIENKLVEKEIKKLLHEKELLLKEVHHRTKNNMSTMISLLSIQSDKLVDPTAIESLKDASKRLRSMSVLYDKLSSNNSNYRELPVNEFLSSLVNEITNIFHNSYQVNIIKKFDDFILDSGRLLSLGIIINELITNSMKYAFTDKNNNEIVISALLKDNYVTIIFQDNGKGLPQTIDLDNSNGIGLMLISALSKQIDSEIVIEREKGTKFILRFEL